MRSKALVLTTALAVAAFGASASAGPGRGHGGGGGHARGKPTKGRSALVVPEGAADADAKCVVDAKFFPAVGRRAERSWLRFKMRKLDADATFTVWIDDPADDETNGNALVQLVTTDALVAGGRGGVNLMLDTKHEATLPFGAALADLAGRAVEVRDSAGTTTVLAGTLPTLR
jgi:hypothetical protein